LGESFPQFNEEKKSMMNIVQLSLSRSEEMLLLTAKGKVYLALIEKRTISIDEYG
jgi:hypothetical protein